MALYLIRHAQSAYNKAALEVINRGEFEFYSTVKNDPSLLDPPITPLGFSQTSQWRACAHQIEVDRVYVSPLLRALQTSRELFEGHPSSPRMIVYPHITEIITAVCDISMGNYTPGFEDYDWAEMNKFQRHWQLDLLEGNEAGNFASSCQKQGRAHLAAYMRSKFPKDLEKTIDAANRVAHVKAWWERELKHERVAFVGHWVFFRYFLYQWNISRTLANSEVFKLPLAKL